MALQIKSRKENKKKPLKKILIVCEGAKTEPSYFEAFKASSQICDIRGSGRNTVSLVMEASKRYDPNLHSEVWVVFDRDSFNKNQVISAHSKATQLGFKTAFSNESFELWYLLHYEYLNTKITRAQYCTKLSTHLGFDYKKNNPNMYNTLLHNQTTAIKNAKTLRSNIFPTGSCPVDNAPYSTVYELVEKLNKLALKRAKG